MIKAALFDLDGVLIDSERQYTVFWGNIFQTYYPGSDHLELKIKGQTLNQIFDAYFPNADDQANITSALNRFESEMEMEYVDGAFDFLTQLKASGCRTAVVTSSNQVKMENVYRCHPEFKSFFDRILTSEDFSKSKPDPECYLTAMQMLDVQPYETYVFEDSINGLNSAKASGGYVVGLATSNPKEVIAPLANEVINDFMGLKVLANNNRLF